MKLVVFLCFLVFVSRVHSEDTLILFGGGSSTGVFGPIVESICADVSFAKESKQRCKVIVTSGSMHNLLGVISGELDAGLTMPALINQAYEGVGIFEKIGPQRQLRAVAAIYTQPVGILVNKNSAIEGLPDFMGRSINIGPEGSGEREIAKILFEQMGWTNKDFSEIFEYATSKVTDGFCSGDIDILIHVFGLPGRFYDNIMNKCDAKLLSLPSVVINEINQKNAFYKKGYIPHQLLPNNDRDVHTLEMDVVVVTRDTVSNEAVGSVLDALFSTPDKVYEIHRAIKASHFSGYDFFSRAIGAPLHDGSKLFIDGQSVENSNEQTKFGRK